MSSVFLKFVLSNPLFADNQNCTLNEWCHQLLPPGLHFEDWGLGCFAKFTTTFELMYYHRASHYFYQMLFTESTSRMNKLQCELIFFFCNWNWQKFLMQSWSWLVHIVLFQVSVKKLGIGICIFDKEISLAINKRQNACLPLFAR